ncbi:MAG TPA: expansin EXLX1 family cellulose-binding protein [Kofleriaceae bacterium]
MPRAPTLLIAIAVVSLAACGGDDGSGGADDGAGSNPGGSCSSAPAPEMGDGTYYAADGTGNCSFDASPNDLLVGAMNNPDYGADAAWCGGCVAITGPKGSVNVRIVDRCPECAKGDIDLSPQAFDMIADHSAGRVGITWHEIACPVAGNLSYEWKDGASQYYFSIQVRNHRYRIAKLEASNDGGATFSTIDRLQYNYFVKSGGMGPGPYTIRTTDTRGHVITDDNIAVGDAVSRPGSAQFPACSGD